MSYHDKKKNGNTNIPSRVSTLSLIINLDLDKNFSPLTQQNDEKHMPTYSHGTRTPDMSLPS